MSQNPESNDWKCHGWEDHERGQLLSGDALSFRDRLKWLEGADRMAAWLETKRAWIDKDGVIHRAKPELKVAEEQANHSATESGKGLGGSPGPDPRG